MEKINKSVTVPMKTGCGELNITWVFNKDGDIKRVNHYNEKGGCKSLLTAVQEAITLFAKYDMHMLDRYLDAIEKIECRSCITKNGDIKVGVDATSCPAAFVKSLDRIPDNKDIK